MKTEFTTKHPNGVLMPLADTDPELVKAGFEALKSVEMTNNGVHTTWFTHQKKDYWIKVTYDLHANTIDSAWIFPAGDPRIGHV